ncbi:MAG TPA: leucyl aminopeptidase [Acidimicrobiia bacterium]|jgi:leucyl aminopeptidase
MTVKLSLSSAAPERARCDVLAVGVYADRKLTPSAQAIDKALGGALVRQAADADFKGRLGSGWTLSAGDGVNAKAVLLVGLGKRDELTLDGVRRAGSVVANKLRSRRSVAVTIVDAVPAAIDADEAVGALAEGVVLGGYSFERYKTKAEGSTLSTVTILGAAGARAQRALDTAAASSTATAWARDMVNEPAAAKSPADMVTAATRLLRNKKVKVDAWAGPELTRRKLTGTIIVGQGSRRAPRFLRMEYAPAGARATVALVGKGVVFDSGGLSLKPSSGMEQMKTDMSGGAAVIATMSVLADLGVRNRVIGYVPLVENMPGGNAYRLGDVITYRNGKTVEVMNTDAEGRLILADALALAADEDADAIIDLATLTGACMVALGPKVAGLFGNNDAWSAQVQAAGERSGEPLWELPLPKEYRKMLDSEIADMKNVGGSYGGAITAAIFLSEFVGKTPWVHLDIAGPARAESDDGYLRRGGTGFGVRTLVELVQSFRRPR